MASSPQVDPNTDPLTRVMISWHNLITYGYVVLPVWYTRLVNATNVLRSYSQRR